jgi:glucose-6-phosphate isomerase
MEGAKEAREKLATADLAKNDCYKYAALRNILYRKGRKVEMLVVYDNSFAMMGEWFKQLFGESEGKDGKGMLPASAVFSTDLHSLGQLIQDGPEMLFETVITVAKTQNDFFIRPDKANADGLNFLSGNELSDINHKAFLGTILAHTEGATPNIVLEMPEMNAFELGYLIYFFEKACAISGYILGVNPFDQPGVEAYKNNMFALLGKPGYEAEKSKLEAQLK